MLTLDGLGVVCGCAECVGMDGIGWDGMGVYVYPPR
jgi:hypothetical protein